jgi:hypothetical protein
MSDHERKLVNVDLSQYCFCGCHADALEGVGRCLRVPYGVHRVDELERELACATCRNFHTADGDEADEPWR